MYHNQNLLCLFRAFVPELCADILKVVPISKEQALQRAGRAGRVSEGMCYRIYSESDHDALNDNQKPEILRSNLSSVLLELISLGMKRPSLRVIDPPDHGIFVGIINTPNIIISKFFLISASRSCFA